MSDKTLDELHENLPPFGKWEAETTGNGWYVRLYTTEGHGWSCFGVDNDHHEGLLTEGQARYIVALRNAYANGDLVQREKCATCGGSGIIGEVADFAADDSPFAGRTIAPPPCPDCHGTGHKPQRNVDALIEAAKRMATHIRTSPKCERPLRILADLDAALVALGGDE